jgi:hypothetical protein
VKKSMDVWECDLVDVQGLSKYKDGIKYLWSVIDVFSKYLHVVLLKSKTGPSVTAEFQSVLKEPTCSKPVRRRPVWLQTDRGKNSRMDRFRTYWSANPSISRVQETRREVRSRGRAHRKQWNKLYRYFTYENTYRFVSVLQHFVKAYNSTVHTTHGMAPAAVTYKHSTRDMNTYER